METCRVKEIFKGVIRLRGWDPETSTVAAGERALVAELVSERLRLGYEFDWWPELMWTEQRRYEADYAADTTYADGDVVWYDDQYWESQEDANLGNTPADDSAYWAAPGDDWVRLLQYRMSGQREIGAVDVNYCLFEVDPRTNPYAAPVQGVKLHYDGIIAPSWAPAEPWVYWRRPAPEVSWTDWAAGTTYAIGDLCYLESTGKCYRANAATTGQSPATYTDVWVEVAVPKFLKRYVVHGAYADRLLEREERYKEEDLAEKSLEELAERMMDQRVDRRARFGR